MSDNKKIYIIPYHNGELDSKINVDDLLVIGKGLRREYSKDTEIIILTIKDSDYFKSLFNTSEFTSIDIEIRNLNNMTELISFYDHNDKKSFIATIGDYLDSGNIIDAQRYIDEANLITTTNKYCIAPIDIKDGKFYRLNFDKLKEVINGIHTMQETILIWYSLEFFNIFKDTKKYLFELAEFIEEEFGAKDVYLIISDKFLDGINMDWYKIVCTQNIIDYYNLKYIEPEWLVIIGADTDSNDQDNTPSNNKPLLLFPYDESKKPLPINTIKNIISNIRSKVSKDADIVIQTLNQEDFYFLSNTDLRMQNGISILISESYFTYRKVIENGYNVIANKVFIPESNPFINIESYID